MDVIYFAKFTALVQLVVHVSDRVVFVTPSICRDSCSLLDAKFGYSLFYPQPLTLYKLTQKELTLRYSAEVNSTLGHHEYKFSATWESTQSYQINIRRKPSTIRGLLEKYPTFGREKETGLLGALDT